MQKVCPAFFFFFFKSARAHLIQIRHAASQILLLIGFLSAVCTLFATIKIFQLNRTCFNNIPYSSTSHLFYNQTSWYSLSISKTKPLHWENESKGILWMFGASIPQSPVENWVSLSIQISMFLGCGFIFPPLPPWWIPEEWPNCDLGLHFHPFTIGSFRWVIINIRNIWEELLMFAY